jgi:D-methionine transport system substrate-binding protein
MAYYSGKYKSIQDLPGGARVGIPSDVSNQTRALLLLETSGLIKLKPGLDASRDAISVTDIVDNPRKFEFVEMAIVVLSKSYRDLDAAAIVNSFASQVGLLATRDGILVEQAETSPYVNIIVVRPQDKDKPWVGKLIRAYQSDEVRTFIKTEFAGSLVPLF